MNTHITGHMAGEQGENQTVWGQDQIVDLLLLLLVKARIPEELQIDPQLMKDPSFQKLYEHIMDLRTLSSSLCKGDLQEFVYSKGYVLSNLKTLQSNLRHLTWQTKKVAEGDFSQRVDFLGEFSDAFNEMTIKLRNSSMQLRKLASLDGLTQIPNRLTLEEFLEDAFLDARVNEKQLSVLMVDIDHFKNVNDTYGHGVGDKVLVKISQVLNKQFRATDIFARYGGEEFVAGLPNTDLAIAQRIAQRARQAVERTEIEIADSLSLQVTVSIGVSARQEGDEGYSDIVRRSDTALYDAKRSGRNRVCSV